MYLQISIIVLRCLRETIRVAVLIQYRRVADRQTNSQTDTRVTRRQHHTALA